jgi:hypothetical protein
MKDGADKYWFMIPLVWIAVIALIAALFYYSFGNGNGGVTIPIWTAPIHKHTIEGHSYLTFKSRIIHSESCTNQTHKTQ